MRAVLHHSLKTARSFCFSRYLPPRNCNDILYNNARTSNREQATLHNPIIQSRTHYAAVVQRCRECCNIKKAYLKFLIISTIGRRFNEVQIQQRIHFAIGNLRNFFQFSPAAGESSLAPLLNFCCPSNFRLY